MIASSDPGIFTLKIEKQLFEGLDRYFLHGWVFMM